MSVVESGRPLSKWSQFWIGVIQLLSCGLCSRESIDPLPSTRENSKQYSIEPSAEKAATVLPASPQVFTAHSPYVEEQAMCLMDLPDDCLLEIIDRLSFLDRMRFRVNKRMNALEPHATAITKIADRHRFKCIKAHRILGGKISVFNDREWIDLPVMSGMIMLQRIIKCCILGTFRGELALNCIHGISNVIRFLKADRLLLLYKDETGLVEEGVSIQPYLECMRNNEKMRQALFVPQRWANIYQLLALIKEAQQLRCNLRLAALSLATTQQLARLIFGIDPSIFDDPPRDVTEIRTSIKDGEVYLKKNYFISESEICLVQGLMKTEIYPCYMFSDQNRFDVFDMEISKRPIYLSNYIRVPYREEQ